MAALADGIRCYAQRLLNPFRGIVNTICYRSAEAVTTDGVNWDIYVSNDQLLSGLEQGRSTQISDIRYGRWSLKNGLTRGPLNPSEDFYRLEAMGAVVYEHLLKVHDRLPFAFEDNIEFWLLDGQGEPLALLNSVVHASAIDEYQIMDWRAGQAAREGFRKASADQRADEQQPSDYETLVALINGRAASPPAAQWFVRDGANADGTGLEGHGIDPCWIGRRLPAASFPRYYLSTRHCSEQQSDLLQAFFDWQSPWFLLLQSLGRDEREHFEQCARKQALAVDDNFRLYPEVIDESFLRSARVEAQLRRNRPRPASDEQVMSTFYIELNPGVGD